MAASIVIEDQWRVGLMMALSVLFLLITMANGAVLYTILRPRNKHRLGTPTNYLVANLALTDVIVAMTTIPGTLLSLHDQPKTFRACAALQCLILLPTKVSAFGYLALTIERVVAIKLPFSYIRLSTMRNTKIVIGLTWLFGIAFVGSGLYRLKANEFKMNTTLAQCTVPSALSLEFMVYVQFIGSTFPTAVAIGVIYVIIIIEIRAMTRDDQRISQKRLSVIEKCRRAEGRAAVRCGLLIGTFFLCQLPIGLAGVCNLWFGVQCRQCKVVFMCLFLGNSALNPVLYSLTNKDLKVEMCRFFRYTRKANRPSANWQTTDIVRLCQLRRHSVQIIPISFSVRSLLRYGGPHAMGRPTQAMKTKTNVQQAGNKNGAKSPKSLQPEIVMTTTAL